MSAPFISRLEPPGEAISSWSNQHKTAAQPSADNIPQLFLDAMSVREEVFIDEQHCSWENEVDSDDPRSHHFVVYASISGSFNDNNNKNDANNTQAPDKARPSAVSIPVGTIRLVPPPHPPHTTPLPSDSPEAHATPKYHDPYLKITRLAVLKPYRHLKLGRLLVNNALDFASKNPITARGKRDPAEVEKLKLQAENTATSSYDKTPTTTKNTSLGGLEASSIQVATGNNPTPDDLQRLITHSTEEWDGMFLIHAQKDARVFWERMGFVLDEGLGEWDEEGIIHVGMWKKVDVKTENSRK